MSSEKYVKITDISPPNIGPISKNAHLWYWSKTMCSIPSINYYFMSMDMAKNAAKKFLGDERKCYPSKDRSNRVWWMVHFYGENKLIKKVHDWFKELARQEEIAELCEIAKTIPTSKGWEKSLNNFSEFKKQFTITEEKD